MQLDFYKNNNSVRLIFFLLLLWRPSFSAAISLDFLFPKADFEAYMQTPLRQKLIAPENDGMQNPNPSDASNWTGCSVGKGELVGTFRDISACAASACYAREVTVEELGSFSYQQARGVLHWVWKKIHAEEIPDQQMANLYMHIQLHYGNLKILERAMAKMGATVKVNGVLSASERRALAHFSKLAPFLTYNRVRAELAAAYQQHQPQFRRAFMRALNQDFPLRSFWNTSFPEYAEKSLSSLLYGINCYIEAVFII